MTKAGEEIAPRAQTAEGTTIRHEQSMQLILENVQCSSSHQLGRRPDHGGDRDAEVLIDGLPGQCRDRPGRAAAIVGHQPNRRRPHLRVAALPEPLKVPPQAGLKVPPQAGRMFHPRPEESSTLTGGR